MIISLIIVYGTTYKWEPKYLHPMNDELEESTQTVAKTYIPQYQKEEWVDHATRLDMSQSEFIRTMVQAGRRHFTEDVEEPDDTHANPRGNDLETRILDELQQEPLEWDALTDRVIGSLEEQLRTAVVDLQDADKISHDPELGYTIRDH